MWGGGGGSPSPVRNPVFVVEVSMPGTGVPMQSGNETKLSRTRLIHILFIASVITSSKLDVRVPDRFL